MRKYVLFIGGDEYKQGLMNLKNMSTGVEEKVALSEIDKLVWKKKLLSNQIKLSTVISKLRS
jgi:histidyl-tRNA synthetase